MELLPFFWEDYAAAKSVFYTGIGWLEDVGTWCSAYGVAAADYAAALRDTAGDSFDADENAVNVAVQQVCGGGPLSYIRTADQSIVNAIGNSIPRQGLTGAVARGDVVSFVAELINAIRSSQFPKPVQENAITFLDSVKQKFPRDDALRRVAMLSVAMCDAKRWLRSSGFATEEDVTRLSAALDAANKRNATLSRVIDKAGITEHGRRVAVSTITDVELGASSTAVASALPPPPPPPPPTPAPVSPVRDAACVMYDTWCAMTGHPGSAEFEAAIRDPADEEALRAIRHAVEWLSLSVNVQRCERISERTNWHVLLVTAKRVIEAAGEVCRTTRPPSRQLAKLKRATTIAADSDAIAIPQKKRRRTVT